MMNVYLKALYKLFEFNPVVAVLALLLELLIISPVILYAISKIMALIKFFKGRH